MTVKITSVKKELKRSALQKIQYQTKNELQRWGNDVLRRKITPVTPIDTGKLRREADIGVGLVGKNIQVVYFNRAPYALTVERAWYGKAQPRTPGTIAPFAEPTIRKTIQDTIAGPIGRGFTI